MKSKKNILIILNYIKLHSSQQHFSKPKLMEDININPNSFNYAMKLLIEMDAIEKVVDVNDLRKTIYVAGKDFDTIYQMYQEENKNA